MVGSALRWCLVVGVLAGSVGLASSVADLGAEVFGPLRLNLEVHREQDRIDELRRGFFAAAAEREAVGRDVRDGHLAYADGLACVRADREPTFRQALAVQVREGAASNEAEAERAYFDDLLAWPGVPTQVIASFRGVEAREARRPGR